jgi:membrane associated rhomboid family serine protease
VTVSTYFFPEVNNVFGGTKQKYYIWQYLTMIFEHGSYDLPPLLHMFANIAVVGFFGVITERLLGIKRFLILNIITTIVYYIYFYCMNGLYVNGGSGIIWAYTSVVLYTVIFLLKNDKSKVIKDFMFYVFILLLTGTWIIITVADYKIHGEVSLGIKSHFISVLLGFFFVLLWKEYIKKKIDSTDLDESDYYHPVHKWIKRIVLLVPSFIIVVLVLTFTGVITNHISKVNIVSITPENSIEMLNKNDLKIVIKFDDSMKKEYQKDSLSVNSTEHHTDQLTFKHYWEDNRNLVLKFNRAIYQDEKIRIALSGLTDSEGLRFKKDIILKYNYQK